MKKKAIGYWVLLTYFFLAILLFLRPQIKQLSFIGKPYNLNEIKLLAEDGLDQSKIRLTLSNGTVDQEVPIFNGNEVSEVPEWEQQNLWKIDYNNELSASFEHNKTQAWHDHQYTFRVYQDSAGVRFHAIAIGPDGSSIDIPMERN